MMRRLLLLVVLACSSLPLAAQLDEESREVAVRVERLVAAGRHLDAVQLAGSSLVAHCGEPAWSGHFDAKTGTSSAEKVLGKGAPGPCARLYFASGYAARSWAEADAKGRSRHLQDAAAAFEKAHDLRPQNRQILTSLVLALRDVGRAAEAYERWRGTGPETPEGRLLLGDLALATGQAAAARRVFSGLERLRPEDPELQRRILLTYLEEPGDPDEHLEWCRRLVEHGLEGLAAEALEHFLAADRGAPELADSALVLWADLEARRGLLDEASVERLEARHARRGVAELRRLLTAPPDSLDERLPFWGSDPYRRSVAAEALRARSRRVEKAGRVDEAVAVLEAARTWAPSPSRQAASEEIRSRPSLWIDATTDLAALLQRQGRKLELDLLVSNLLSEKNQFYRQGDLESIHRSHTVLGLIFTEQERWTSRSYDNATFQLEHALSTARRLAERRQRPAPPLPHLETRLARAYQATDRGEEAGEAYFQASLGYLQLDDLGNAQASLRRAGALDVSPVRVAGVEEIVRDREAVASGRFAADRLLQAAESPTWLTGRQLEALPEDFVETQRFKVFADLAARESQQGREEEAALLMLQARGMAQDLEVETEVDDLRLERLEHGYRDLRLAAPDVDRLERQLDDSPLRLQDSGRVHG